MPSLALPMPDLVRVNERIRARLDPLFRRRWVRRLAWAGVAFYVLFIVTWLLFATGLPSSKTLLAYQPPLPTNVRGDDGNPVPP